MIILCVRWYLRYPLSYEHVAELVAERGVEVDASCIWRWVQAYAPELNKRCRPHLKPTNKSYRIDETYIKVKGEDKYLYRALDSTGQTIDFLLTAKRDTAAAKRFLRKAIERIGQCHAAGDERGQEPGISGCGGSAESRWRRPPAGRFTSVQVSQQRDRTGPPDSEKTSLAGQGLWSFQSAWRTLQGIETVHMIRKGRVRWLAKGDAVGQALFIAELFGLAA